jgi:hypothetical protein
MKQQSSEEKYSESIKEIMGRNPEFLVLLAVGLLVGIFLKYVLYGLFIAGLAYVIISYKKKNSK